MGKAKTSTAKMGKAKQGPADAFLIDLYRIGFRAWPLFGLKRLVRLAHRKRSGVLYCDNVMCISEAITFSPNNIPDSLYTISHGSPAHAGVYAEPRLNAPNEASPAAIQRFHDDGAEVVFTFTPKPGKTFSIESDKYRTFDAGLRYVWGQLPENGQIARWELTLDVSAYMRRGYAYCREPPWCEFEAPDAGGQRRRRASASRPAIWVACRPAPALGSGTSTTWPAESIAWPGDWTFPARRLRRRP